MLCMCCESCDNIHQAFPLCFCALQVIKNWSWGMLGRRLYEGTHHKLHLCQLSIGIIVSPKRPLHSMSCIFQSSPKSNFTTLVLNGRSAFTITYKDHLEMFAFKTAKVKVQTFDTLVAHKILFHFSYYIPLNYHMSNSHEYMGVSGEVNCSYMLYQIFYYKSRKNPYQYYKSHENLYHVLQVTCTASERAMKSKIHMIK